MAAEAIHPAVLQSAFVRRSQPMQKYLLGSVAGHALLIGAILLVSWIRREPPLDLDQKPIHATLIRKGKPRDDKLLPRKEEEPPPPPEKVDAAPKPPDPIDTKPAVAVPIPGVKPQTAPAKQDGVKGSAADRRKALFGAFGKAGKAPTADELEGAVDGDENGDSATQEGERYYGAINAAVHRHYDVSQTLSEQERMRLRSNVALQIARDGHAIKVMLAKSSGNDLFDNAVLLAVKKAQPFPPPPDQLRSAVERGIILSFTP